MVEHIPRRTKEEVIARQNAEAARILRSRHPPHRHLPPVYGSGMSYLEFAIASLLGLAIPFCFLLLISLGSGVPYFPLQLAFGVVAIIIACLCYLNLDRAHAPSAAVAALFTFAIVSMLGIWVPFGGIITIIAGYLLMTHNGWLEG